MIMDVIPVIRILLAISSWAVVAGSGLSIAAEEGKFDTVRQEIGKPIKAAQELVKARRGKEALAKIHETDTVGGKSPYETYVVELTRGQAATLVGDATGAAAAFEAAAAVAPSGKAQLLGAAASQHYSAKNYPKAADAAARYFKEGGTDQAVRTLQTQSFYLAGDLVKAARELQADVKTAEEAGKPAQELQLQILAEIANRQKDNAGFIGAMEKLVAHYPKKEYWLSLVYSVSTRPGLSSQLTLDVLRVKFATGTMRTAEEYVEAAQLAIQAGFPVEAKKFVDVGYEAHLMGSGADAERHKRLRDTTAKALAEDTRTLGQDDAKYAAMANGDPLLNTGLNYVLRGQAEKGLPLMEQAIKKGGLKRAEDAKLHLGVAQFMAGHKVRAVETLRGVKGTDGPAEIARLWILLAQRS